MIAKPKQKALERPKIGLTKMTKKYRVDIDHCNHEVKGGPSETFTTIEEAQLLADSLNDMFVGDADRFAYIKEVSTNE